MKRLKAWWARLPFGLRVLLGLVIWVPVCWLFLWGLISVMADELAPTSEASTWIELLIYASLALILFAWLKSSANRTHGGVEKRKAFSSAIRTGVLTPEADRDRLKALVDRFYAGRRTLYIVSCLGAALLLLPTAFAVLDAPLERRELGTAVLQLVPAMLFLVPGYLFIRRRDRQMAVLKDALEADDSPAATS